MKFFVPDMHNTVCISSFSTCLVLKGSNAYCIMHTASKRHHYPGCLKQSFIQSKTFIGIIKDYIKMTKAYITKEERVLYYNIFVFIKTLYPCWYLLLGARI